MWFGTVYIEMLLLTPFLNVLLNNIKRTKLMLILLFVINTVPTSFLFRNDFFLLRRIGVVLLYIFADGIYKEK